MDDLRAGYVNLTYPICYSPELNPVLARVSLLAAHYAAPQVALACELGFGQGLSCNIHAAASSTTWYGTDFDSAQVSFARQLAAVSGADARLFDEAFVEFCQRTDLPEFDFVGLHGIWSWISDDNRAVIVDFLRRKLKPGGVAYFGYDALAGWTGMLPIRDALVRYVNLVSAPAKGALQRVEVGLEFIERLLATSPLFAHGAARVVSRLKTMWLENRVVFTHQFFNEHWAPMTFSQMAQWLAPAKLGYACSTSHFEQHDRLNLNTDQQALLQELPDATLRETVRDLMVNRCFRTDYWVKGARKLSATESADALRRQRVVLTRPRADVSVTARGVLGERAVAQSMAQPILDVLADHRVRSVEEVELAVKGRGMQPAHVFEVLRTLSETRSLAFAQDEAVIDAARQQTDRLNTFLCQRARYHDDTSFLASPVTGGGRLMDRYRMFFVSALHQGATKAAELAAIAVPMIETAEMEIIVKEKTSVSADDRFAALVTLASSFLDEEAPILSALRIV